MNKLLILLAVSLLLATGKAAAAEQESPLVRLLYTANGFGYFHACPT